LTTDETEACLIIKDRKGQALAYVYFEDERASRRAELTYYDHRQATTERCDAWCVRLRGDLCTRSTKILRPGVVVALMFAVCILLAIAVALTFCLCEGERPSAPACSTRNTRGGVQSFPKI
jgi:hypothetical protein